MRYKQHSQNQLQNFEFKLYIHEIINEILEKFDFKQMSEINMRIKK